MKSTDTRTQAQVMIDLNLSFIPARVIYVAAKLGLADHVGDRGATAQDLARLLDVHAAALFRLMRTLTGLGVLRQDQMGTFFLTEFGDTLRKDSPQSVCDYVIYSHEFIFGRFSKLLHSVQTGRPAIENFFEVLKAYPDQEAIFLAGSANKSRVEAAGIIAAYDFSGCGKVADIGGGTGAFLSGVLAACSEVTGLLFDQESAIEAARKRQASRCEFIAGDFFATVPTGADTYVLKRIIDDWSDEKSIQILTNCRKAMKDGSRLLIIEPLMGPPNELSPGHLADMNFLVTFHDGRIRTEAEHAALLSAAGLRLKRVVPTASEVSVLEAVPS